MEEFSGLGVAGKQFIENTPWANPKHSSHKIFQPSGQQEATTGAASFGQPGGHESPRIPNRLSSGSPEATRPPRAGSMMKRIEAWESGDVGPAPTKPRPIAKA
jgi:hypothetical protein